MQTDARSTADWSKKKSFLPSVTKRRKKNEKNRTLVRRPSRRQQRAAPLPVRRQPLRGPLDVALLGDEPAGERVVVEAVFAPGGQARLLRREQRGKGAGRDLFDPLAEFLQLLGGRGRGGDGGRFGGRRCRRSEPAGHLAERRRRREKKRTVKKKGETKCFFQPRALSSRKKIIPTFSLSINQSINAFPISLFSLSSLSLAVCCLINKFQKNRGEEQFKKWFFFKTKLQTTSLPQRTPPPTAGEGGSPPARRTARPTATPGPPAIRPLLLPARSSA